MSLNYTITHQYNKISVPENITREVLDKASWNEEPTFLTQGRTAWFKLKEPIKIQSEIPFNVKAIKMKGIGVWNPEGRHALKQECKPIPPTNLIYQREAPHFGFDKEGNIVKIHSADAPYGGICHNRAIQEYENAQILFESGVYSIIPYMVIKYDDLFFETKSNISQMGAVLSLCPEENPYRLLFLGWDNKYVTKELLEYYDCIKKRLNISGNILDVRTKLAVSAMIAEQFGNSVRGFTEAGRFIHSGGWENIQFDMERGHIFLTDLDSSKDINIIPERMRAIQSLRDLISNLYRYLNKVYYPKAIKMYGLENILEYDIPFYLIKGYMPEISDVKIKEISRKIWNFFIPYFLIMKNNEFRLEDIPKDIRKSFKFDTDYFYILCLNLLYPEFLKTKSKNIKNDSFTPKELLEKSKNYLGENFSYIEMFL